MRRDSELASQRCTENLTTQNTLIEAIGGDTDGRSIVLPALTMV